MIDFSIGLVLDFCLRNSPDGRYYKANYSLSSCSEEVVIFGSSRAETNYVPYVFEDSLEMSVWNTGRGGQTLPFWYATQQSILSRYTPEIVIINIEEDLLSKSLDLGYERAGFLRPYYYAHPEIRPIIDEISKKEKFMMLSKLYAYNSSYYYLFRPYFIKGIDGRIVDKGWKSRNETVGELKTGIESLKIEKDLDQESVLLFNKFLKAFLDNNCSVFLVVSPNHNYYVDFTSTLNYCKKLDDIVILDYSSDVHFVGNEVFFSDNEHLNRSGAIEFSKVIGSEIKKYID